MNKKLYFISIMTLSILFSQISYSSESKINKLPQETVLKGCEPFSYHNSNEKACLLLHGLGGCPHELSLVGEYLSKKGYTVIAPRYPGHGSKGKYMGKYGWQDWYKVAEDNYLEMKKTYKEVDVIGFSTGGTIGLKLAEKYDIHKLVLLSPFINITYKWYYIFRPETYLNSVGKLIDDLPSDMTVVHLNDPIARSKYVHGSYFSLKATRSALELIEDVKSKIKQVKSPTLTIHSTGDETTDYSSSEYIYKNISSPLKTFVTLHKSNHIIGLDYEKEIVFNEISKFLQ